jgi:hypothetical protein
MSTPSRPAGVKAAGNFDASPSRTDPPDGIGTLGVCALGWLAVAALERVLGPTQEAGALGGGAEALHPGQFVVPLLAGILWQSVAAMAAPASRLRRAGVLWAGWSFVQIAFALAPQRLDLPDPWGAVDFAAQQAGLVLGIAGGWLCPPAFAGRLRKWLEPCRAITVAVVVVASVVVILVPLSPDTPLFGPPAGWRVVSAGAYLKSLPGQLYLVLKPFVLWVPAGLLFALAQRSSLLRRWVVAAATTFLVAGVPLLHDVLRVGDLLEILGAYWGSVAGLWLGARTGLELPSLSVPAATSSPPATGAAASAGDGASTAGLGILRALRQVAAVFLLVGVAIWAWYFPRCGTLLLGGLALYALLVLRYRHAWLLVVPVALPLLDLAPGTGRFFFDEFDMLMAVTVAMGLWHGAVSPPYARLDRALALALALFGISVLVSLVVGLLPFSPLDANAFASLFSHYNSLRVAKGFLWAVPLFCLMIWTLPAQANLLMRLFVPGMWLGLAGVIVAGLWEHWQFAGGLDVTSPYRITATFSSMHTGGSDIETYLVTAIPFVWLAFSRQWPVSVRSGALVLVALGAYLMALTVSRGGVAALGLALIVLLLSSWRKTHPANKSIWSLAVAALAILGGVMFMAVGPGGSYWQRRLASSAEDWNVRVSHWREALEIRDRDVSTALFGMGLGRFPEAYLFRSGSASLPGTYAFVDEDGNRFLRLGGGETLYMAQRVAVSAGTRYTLSLRVRSSRADARLGIPLCEKHLLDSLRCQWRVVAVPGDGSWHRLSFTIDTGPVGEGNWLTRRPVDLSLYNETQGTRIDVDDVELRNDSGADLVRNGDFAAGGDYWFFKTHSHLPWHIKNLWVEVLFEQGWVGLLSFLLLLGVLLAHLTTRAVRHEDRLAAVLLASTSGFLAVGLFGSLFDTPRIATLFFLLVVVAATALPQGTREPAR